MNCARRLGFAASVLVLAGTSGAPIRGADRALLDVTRAELTRNFDVLRREATPAYFIAYTVHDVDATQLSASLGSLWRNDEAHTRSGSVEVRVGDYQFDNTHPLRGDTPPTRLVRVSLPIADTALPIAQSLWLATDRAYKQATESITRAKTNAAATVQDGEQVPDFSREESQSSVSEPVRSRLDVQEWSSRLRRVSAIFAGDPLIFQSDVSLAVSADNRYLVNTEGTQIASGALTYRLFINALTKAEDGMELPVYATYFSRTADGLPDEKRLAADAREMMAMLGRLRAAPIVSPYSGPAILSGRAAGVFFHEIFGHRVEGHRQKDAEDGQTFGKKIGEPVLPAFLSVAFDPTVQRIGDTELMGSYAYDDEGVKARRVEVVGKGILETFLLGRAPLAAFPHSNGHGRAEPGFVPVSRQSNLIVEATKSVSFDTLVSQLKSEARRQGKPFGLLFENIEGGFTTTGRNNPNAFNVMPTVVYRVYTDGRPLELVRGVDLIGTPLAAFGKFLAAGDRPEVFNGICGAESGGVPVSAVSPALLVSEVEVQKKAQSQERLPILPAPPAASGAGISR